jgi:uncharacterized delta-60 repeat protein
MGVSTTWASARARVYTCRLARVLIGLVALTSAPVFAVSGTLDPGFGTGGKVMTPTNGDGRVHALLTLTHNNVVDTILAAGKNGDNFGVALYDGAGIIQTGFGGPNNNGIATIFAANGGAAQAMALRSDHLLLVTGGANGFMSTVLDSTGANSTPTRTTGVGGQGIFWGYGLVLLPADAYMMFGQAGVGQHCALARYDNTTTLDTTFGNQGATFSDLGNCFAMVQDGTGFVVSAEKASDGHNGFGVARLTATGALDTNYGTNGIATVFEDTLASVRALARQSNGKIVAVGKAGGLGTPVSLVVARFNSNGVPDPDFGQGGAVALGLQGTDIGLVANAVALEEPAGNIIVGGAATAPGNVKDGSGKSVFLIFRFLPDGKPDQTFGPDSAGLVLTGFGTGVDSEIRALTIQADGKLLAAGNACPGGLCGFALARYVLSAPSSTTTTTQTTTTTTKPTTTTTTTTHATTTSTTHPTTTSTTTTHASTTSTTTTTHATTTTTHPATTTTTHAATTTSTSTSTSSTATPLSTTTVTIATTTTTSLPSCSQRTGSDALRCLCAAGISIRSCDGEPVPPAVGADFTRACSTLTQAASTTPGKKARHLYNRARTFLARAATITRRAAKKKKHGVGAACAGNLQTIFTSGRTLVGGVLAGQK